MKQENVPKRRMKNRIIFMLVLLLFIPLNVRAVDCSIDYSSLMADCVLEDNEVMGEYYANKRSKKVATFGGNDYSYEDIEILSKIIEAEAGMEWLDDYIRMCVGEVVLNRVESIEFPDTIAEVVFEEGQYHHVKYGIFEEIKPTRKSIDVALRLLNGERVLNNESVVFQANFPQGSGIYMKVYDTLLGMTYLCYSNNIELYQGE